MLLPVGTLWAFPLWPCPQPRRVAEARPSLAARQVLRGASLGCVGVPCVGTRDPEGTGRCPTSCQKGPNALPFASPGKAWLPPRSAGFGGPLKSRLPWPSRRGAGGGCVEGLGAGAALGTVRRPCPGRAGSQALGQTFRRGLALGAVPPDHSPSSTGHQSRWGLTHTHTQHSRTHRHPHVPPSGTLTDSRPHVHTGTHA